MQAEKQLDEATQVELDVLWKCLDTAREKNKGKKGEWRKVGVNKPDPIFSFDGVILDFFQSAILDQLKKSSMGTMGYVLDEVTDYLSKNGLVEVGHCPSRDGRLCTISLTERSKNNEISHINK